MSTFTDPTFEKTPSDIFVPVLFVFRAGDETWTYGDNPFGNTTKPVKVIGTFTFENGSKIDFKEIADQRV